MFLMKDDSGIRTLDTWSLDSDVCRDVMDGGGRNNNNFADD